MKRNLNKKTRDLIEDFKIKSNTGHISRTEFKHADGTTGHSISCDLFADIDDTKRVIAFLRGKGFDPFKKGTKEPIAIEAALKDASWDTIKDIDPSTSGSRSMFDSMMGSDSPSPKKGLLTKEITDRFAKIGSQEGVADPIVIAKFFDPSGAGTWFATEYNPVDGMFFGYVTLFGLGSPEDEWGSFSLAELESVRGAMGLGIERDRHCGEFPISKVLPVRTLTTN